MRAWLGSIGIGIAVVIGVLCTSNERADTVAAAVLVGVIAYFATFNRSSKIDDKTGPTDD
jgi:hypothetical protein